MSACAAVDQFGPRVYDSNLNSQFAMNQETLLNIVRASRFQPLNFVAVSQVTGGQAETLSTGLPTIVFGPGQTVAQKQAVFGANSVSSNVQGGFTFAPLVSTAFQDGMLSPMSTRTLAQLVAAHPREPVYYAAIDSIRLKTPSMTVSYRNDPSDDKGDDCPARVERSFDKAFFLNDRACSYSKFVNFLRIFLAEGLTAELVPCDTATPGCPPPKQNTGFSAMGRFCFDPPLAAPTLRRDTPKPLCGTKITPSSGPLTITMQTFGTVQPEFVLRSPTGVFKYLGKLLRENTADRVVFYTAVAKALPGRFLEIVPEIGGNCFVLIAYDGQSFCVPQGAYKTAMMLDILEQLRNLSITPADLNAPYSVRLIN